MITKVTWKIVARIPKAIPIRSPAGFCRLLRPCQLLAVRNPRSNAALTKVTKQTGVIKITPVLFESIIWKPLRFPPANCQGCSTHKQHRQTGRFRGEIKSFIDVDRERIISCQGQVPLESPDSVAENRAGIVTQRRRTIVIELVENRLIQSDFRMIRTRTR